MRQIGRGGLSPFSGLVLIATGSLLLLAGYLASLVSASATGADLARKSAAVSTPAWTFIGPEHVNEQANFGGPLIAPRIDADAAILQRGRPRDLGSL